ncbi:GNAT family N-acetyltransferase [Arthrobacter zhangbolii]|uniref:GNAT family N-acetyltransferase n=1 Tax=Arthrobacter zhangbolii TaxID=2886936 RepID=A0A9X1M746_9MICC|nr:GNAT family N-acetyltransferase [Arthrobacter zhangbolii]MCC3271762.1 GNAT family N-acetyltransferase [Arthrobacter zhangbolii]UON93411.1 GNAT family N-acetyltransferase [Arthrobacter zhangbolii]
MPTVDIRRATEKDMPALGRVHVAAWQWAYRGQMPDTVLDTMDAGRRADGWTRMVREGTVPAPHVAVAGADVVGFSHAGTSRDDDAGAQVGEVTALYLREQHVGTGLGRRLWEAALDQLERSGHTEVSVWVLDTNQRGRAFYERMGLTLDGAAKTETLDGFPLTEVRYRAALG